MTDAYIAPPPNPWIVATWSYVQVVMVYIAAKAILARIDPVWMAILLAVAVGCTLILMGNLGHVALGRGQHAGWGWMSLLGPIGVIVVYCLPNRSIDRVPGFPIELTRSEGEP